MSRPTPASFKKAKFKNCEQIAARYFESLDFRFVKDQKGFLEDPSIVSAEHSRIVIYDQRHGPKSPDFTLYEKGVPIAVVEHEDLNLTDRDRGWIRRAQEAFDRGETSFGECTGSDPYLPIRRTLEVAAEQLREVEGVPTMVIIHDYSGMRSTDSWSVLGAMYGAIVLQMTRPDANSGFGDPITTHGAGGAMIDRFQADINRRVSAVAILSRKHLNALLEKQEAPTPTMTIYCNPLADIQWPETLHGPGDTVYRHRALSQTFEIVYQPPGTEPPPPYEQKLKAPSEITFEDLMNDKALRSY